MALCVSHVSCRQALAIQGKFVPSALDKLVVEMALNIRRDFCISDAKAGGSPFELKAILGSVKRR